MSMFGKHEKRPHPVRNFFLIVGFGLCVFIAALIGAAYYLSPQDSLRPADAIVVVSGGQTVSRAVRGIELYQKGLAPKIIFSGAALDDGPSNAREMAAEARRRGVPERDIIVEEAAQTTLQNAEKTRPIIDRLQAKTIYLVTSPYHQRRTLMTFRNVYGSGYAFLNESSFDSRWSKAAWWASPFGVWITGSELAKVGWIYATGQYQ